MKKIFTLLVTVAVSQFAVAQTTVPVTVTPPVEVLELKEVEFDFGKIPQGKPVTHDFMLINTGKTALVLDNVQASCGCTTPEWSKEPIGPGASTMIKVGYNAASEGQFHKSISVTYNSTQVKQLFIKGEVWKTPVSPAPENKALGNLKN